MTPSFLDARLLAARVRSEGASAVLSEARAHGLLGLLAQVAGPHLHPDIDDLRRRLMLEEAMATEEMRRVVAAMGRAGIKSVILKGGALAHTHYPEPWCRTRVDLDLLIGRADRHAAAAVLQALGYAAIARVHGDLVNQQDQWQRVVPALMTHAIDLHVEVTNRAFFASRLVARDLIARAVAAPFAGSSAWQLDAVDALMLSCVHRVAHHSGESRLIWDADVSRQAEALSAAQIETLIERATTCEVAAVCAHELQRARTAWGRAGGALSDNVLTRLADAGAHETSRAFLREGRGLAGDLWLDLRGLPHWRDRARLLLEHVMPSPEYLLSEPGTTRAMLPWLYVRRLIRGALRWSR